MMYGQAQQMGSEQAQNRLRTGSPQVTKPTERLVRRIAAVRSPVRECQAQPSPRDLGPQHRVLGPAHTEDQAAQVGKPGHDVPGAATETCSRHAHEDVVVTREGTRHVAEMQNLWCRGTCPAAS